MEHVNVGVSALKYVLFRMPYKTKGTLTCVFNIIFYLFSIQQSQENPPQYLLLRCKGEGQRFPLISKNRLNTSLRLKVKVNTANIHQILINDPPVFRYVKYAIAFTSEHIPVFRSKKEL